MQGEKLRGTKLRSSQIFSIIKQDFETIIIDVKTKSEDSFELVCIETSRGRVECKYYKAEEADRGIVLIGGAGGDFQTPADSLYPRLGDYFKEKGVSVLNIKFRKTGNLAESITDALVGIEFLKSENIKTFGLIVNELVTNSFKHAFPDKNKGEIQIRLYRDEEGECIKCINEDCSTTYTLTVSDNGVGIPEGFDVEDVESLGMQLVITLVDQLDGELELKRNNRTEFNIRFTVNENNDKASSPAQPQSVNDE